MTSKSANSQLQTWLKSTPKYSKLTSTSIHSKAEKNTLELFHQAAARVPAYKDFLKLHHIKPASIKSISDFHSLPATTKENYITAYPLHLRCWDGNLNHIHMISGSSGTSGQPHYWPRSLDHELIGADTHEFLFNQVCGVKENQPTLFINGFAMGNWIAGTFTLACTTLNSWKGYPLTSATPGYDSEAIIQTIKELGTYFSQIIISGHTPFLKELVETATNQGIDWTQHHVILLGTGQGITENWRDYILQLLGSKHPFNTFINLYGSADAALMGVETPATILLRRHIHQHPELLTQIFQDSRLPSLYQYDPRHTFFDQIGGELHLTKNYGCPLIHYNIHDQGDIHTFPDFLDHFPDLDSSKINQLTSTRPTPFPFVHLFGRQQFMVKIYGANVYTEHVQHALNHPDLQPHISGRFVLEEGFDDNQNPRLLCHIELTAHNQIAESQLKSLIHDIFVTEVRRLNSEYNFLFDKIGDKVKPHIHLYPHGHPKLFPKGKIKKTA